MLILSATSYAQLALKLNLESGIHLRLNDSLDNQINSIHRIIGSLKYKHKEENSVASFSVKVLPEIFDGNINSIKFNPKGLFLYYAENIVWKSILSIQHNSYNFLLKQNRLYK